MHNVKDIISKLIVNAINGGSQSTVEVLYTELVELLSSAGQGLKISTKPINNGKQLRSTHFIVFFNKTSIYANNLYV